MDCWQNVLHEDDFSKAEGDLAAKERLCQMLTLASDQFSVEKLIEVGEEFYSWCYGTMYKNYKSNKKSDLLPLLVICVKDAIKGAEVGDEESILSLRDLIKGAVDSSVEELVELATIVSMVGNCD